MKVNDNPCNFTATYKAKVTLSRQEWVDKTNEIISAVLMQVAGGSPLATYETKEALDLAEPPSEAPENGYVGTRLVKTDVDGKAHWYYFKSDLKQWLDGGIYVAVNLEEYCKTNGFYALLGAGYAAQLLSPNGNVISKDTFISRETYNGSSFGAGAAVLRKIYGNTICENQLLSFSDYTTTSKGVEYQISSPKNQIKINSNGSTSIYPIIPIGTFKTFKLRKGNKYLLWYNINQNIECGVRLRNKQNQAILKLATSELFNSLIFTSEEEYDSIEWYGLINTTYTNVILTNIQLIDLTQMYGKGREPETIEDGKLDNVINNFISYNTGTLKSAKPTKLVSKNADGTKTSEIVIAPEIQALVGYGLSAGTTQNEVDLINQKFIKKIVSYDLGNVDWVATDQPDKFKMGGTVENAKNQDYWAVGNVICDIYKSASEGYLDGGAGDKLISAQGLIIKIQDDNLIGKSNEQIKAYLKGHIVQYEVNEYQIIDLPVKQDNKYLGYLKGIEEWKGTQVSVPTEIGYLPDLINKLWDLLTAEQQKAIDDRQDERLTALENRINQLEARVTALEPTPTFDEEVK